MSSTAHSIVMYDKDPPWCVLTKGTGTNNLTEATGYVHSVETAGTSDGPGIRYIIFTSGCPLACQYCHNPDTQRSKCGKVTSAADLCADISSYASFLKKANGGVTMSGGEPLMQPEFTRAIFIGCKAMGLHTALDTSGFLGNKASDELLELTDMVLLDIKSGLPDLYREVTGTPLQPTLDFARRLADMNKKTWIRFVVVPGLTDAPENIHAVAEIVSGMPNVSRIDLLPFHKMGEYKWKELGKEYKLSDTREANDDDIKRARDIFESHGLRAI